MRKYKEMLIISSNNRSPLAAASD